jgi:hypothetical protein
MVAKDRTIYVWDAQAKGYTPRSKYLVYVFRRKSADACPVGGY